MKRLVLVFLVGCTADTFTAPDAEPETDSGVVEAAHDAAVEAKAVDAGHDVAQPIEASTIDATEEPLVENICPGFGVCTPGSWIVWGDDGGSWTSCEKTTPSCPSGLHCGTYSGWEYDASSQQSVCP